MDELYDVGFVSSSAMPYLWVVATNLSVKYTYKCDDTNYTIVEGDDTIVQCTCTIFPNVFVSFNFPTAVESLEIYILNPDDIESLVPIFIAEKGSLIRSFTLQNPLPVLTYKRRLFLKFNCSKNNRRLANFKAEFISRYSMCNPCITCINPLTKQIVFRDAKEIENLAEQIRTMKLYYIEYEQ